MNLKTNLEYLKNTISQAEQQYYRVPGSVLLLAVSKQQTVETISQACALGIRHFGENYLQEAQKKIEQLKDLPLCWHFIGPIQSNKTKVIASKFSWVHGIDRLSIALKLNQHRSTDLPPLNVCLQINIAKEASKSGIDSKDAEQLALSLSTLPHLRLRGLMTIFSPKTQEEQLSLFKQLKLLIDSLNQKLGLNMDTLSMGMSDDLIPAIQAGATIVRVGSALFGKRNEFK